jgi:hypothetical protein
MDADRFLDADDPRRLSGPSRVVLVVLSAVFLVACFAVARRVLWLADDPSTRMTLPAPCTTGQSGWVEAGWGLGGLAWICAIWIAVRAAAMAFGKRHDLVSVALFAAAVGLFYFGFSAMDLATQVDLARSCD